MPLDVEPPDPPQLTNRGVPAEFEAVETEGSEAEFRREELETAFDEGAWHEAFDEWAEYTDLPEAAVRLLADRGTFRAFDFFWNPEEAALDFTAPALPADLPDDLDGERLDPATVRTELLSLGRTVVEMLADGYLPWGETAVDEEMAYLWGDETFGESPDREE